LIVIFSTLVISDADRRWLERLRLLHDPQQGLVEAHFTLVFPFEGLTAQEVAKHVSSVAQGASPIAFRLTKAEAVRDLLAPRSHVFLLPTEGAEHLHELHGRLYSGLLARFRHPTVAYAPHVTVAAFPEHEAAQKLAADLPPFDIVGRLVTLTTATFVGGKLVVLEAVSLGGL
jgi:2'-5' RNA ligase